MRATRVLTIVGTAVLTIFLFIACAERLAEFGLEQALEAGSEGNLDIDLDFDSDGGFSVSGSEGGEEFSFNLDTDDGTIVFGGPDGGGGVVEFDEDGIAFDTSEGSGTIGFDQENGQIEFDTTEGSGTIGFDEENGQIDFDTDQGSGQINFDEGGISIADGNGDESFTVDQSDDGSTTITTADSTVESSPDPLSGWPEYIGFPASRADGSTFNRLTDGNGTTWTGFFLHAPSDGYLDALRQSLNGVGFIRESSSEFDGQSGVEGWSQGDITVSVQWTAGTTIVSVEGA